MRTYYISASFRICLLIVTNRICTFLRYYLHTYIYYVLCILDFFDAYLSPSGHRGCVISHFRTSIYLDSSSAFVYSKSLHSADLHSVEFGLVRFFQNSHKLKVALHSAENPKKFAQCGSFFGSCNVKISPCIVRNLHSADFF